MEGFCRFLSQWNSVPSFLKTTRDAKTGAFKCYWFLSELGKHVAKNDLKAPSASAKEMPSLLLTVGSVEFSFLPKWCSWTIVLSAERWHSDPDGFPLKGCPWHVRCCPCFVLCPAADGWCVACLPLTLQLCTSSGSFGFCPLETARERGISLRIDCPCWSPCPLISYFFTRKLFSPLIAARSRAAEWYRWNTLRYCCCSIFSDS